MGRANDKVLKITRTIYVLASEAQDERYAWTEYFNNCEAELSKDPDVIEEGTNASFGKDLGWEDDDEDDDWDDDEADEEAAMHRDIMGDDARNDDLL